MSEPFACLDAQQIERLQTGQLTTEETTRVQAHLQQCSSCLARAQATLFGAPTGPPPLPRPTKPDLPQQLGRYSILGVIGEGGMGIVYRARDEHLQRPLAIKVLRPEHRTDSSLVQRFLREAQIMGQLQHPGVAPVHELRVLPDGRPCFTMKQIEGHTFAELLRQRRPGDDLTLPLATFTQVCQTLAYAHAQRIIHRDLKPDNIMVGAFGEVQVMDWGLAKNLAMSAADDRTSLARQAPGVEGDGTVPGTIMGTPAYMAPEQARGEVELVDERSDVFGLGAILCEILTGQPPYLADKTVERRLQAARADLEAALQRLQQCGAAVELMTLCRRCLAAAQQQRPRHAGEVAEALAQYQAGVQQRMRAAELAQAAAQAKAAAERKRRRVSVALALLALVFVVTASAAAVWYVRQEAERAEQAARDEAERARLEAARNKLAADKAFQEQEQAAQNRKLNDQIVLALDKARRGRQQIDEHLSHPLKTAMLLSNPEQEWKGRLEQAEQALQGAFRLADNLEDGVEAGVQKRLRQVAEELKVSRQQWELGQQCLALRDDAAKAEAGKIEQLQIGPRYKKFFQGLGLDFQAGDAEQLAEAVAKSPLRYVWVAALDHWAENTPRNSPLLPRLLTVARRADPDPWRDRIRDFATLYLKEQRHRLAAQIQAQAPVPQHSPHVLLLLAATLDEAEAVHLLRWAVVVYPRDFWLHFYLGARLTKPAERVSCYQAALAVRPDSAIAYNNLGVTLRADGKLDAAIAAYRKAISCSAKHANAFNNLSNALLEKGEAEEAIQAARQAIDLDKQHALAHFHLGSGLYLKGDMAGAVAAYDQALALKPNLGLAHVFRGLALRAQGLLPEAETALTQAIPLVPKHTWVKEELEKTKRWLLLEKRLPKIAAGEEKLNQPWEAIEFAELCRQPFHRWYALAFQLYRQAFVGDGQLEVRYRLDAAGAAILLAAGKDAKIQVTGAEAADLRHQALQWLQAYLAAATAQVQADQVVLRNQAKNALLVAKRDPALASVRDAAALHELPRRERLAWQQFWADVDQTLVVLSAPSK
jgi:serine/threonine-protein kinase